MICGYGRSERIETWNFQHWLLSVTGQLGTVNSSAVLWFTDEIPQDETEQDNIRPTTRRTHYKDSRFSSHVMILGGTC